ncbi:guanylate kinase [Prosthecochloris sp. N3]|uniref:Guanylate kinase n=1 Tax=Prosthecochloris ethylica TaxID=2743976 RepID=A0ABR9XS31_9CHLB|nr:MULTISPECIES: guanylate kinase [Prosthecochloris]MBF0586853.1 guanylate kinase [Prosthecochloris ethylica]MBF0636799.1 guanylate kinase [Prosthecochloris ethylica]NUK48015.1 guanylate kinase [Prosthecochloris ethylica]RNA64307.1 guanylate kinase [Prosthecochloris sp. ZM_2]
MSEQKSPEGKLIVFSAPSGTGKSTIAARILQQFDNLKFSVSATTRPMREGEVDGINYFFLSRERFEQYIESGGFIEYEHFFGNYYGTLLDKTREAIDAGTHLLFDLDVKGALNLKRFFPRNALLIFIRPPSMEVLRERLMLRDSEEDEAALQERLDRAAFEISCSGQFDREVVNDNLDEAVATISAMIGDFISQQ